FESAIELNELQLQLAVLWGCTNPYPKRSTEGIEHVKREIKFHQFLADVKFLFLNIKVNLHLGSLVYYFTLYDCFTHRLLIMSSSRFLLSQNHMIDSFGIIKLKTVILSNQFSVIIIT
uniref:Uncharacterized protein n=1 Tax=Oncorhynchus tshawytscha TaxID=74940 RepID=A0A8C8JD71_ONCTS